jgi:hypothetical protein
MENIVRLLPRTDNFDELAYLHAKTFDEAINRNSGIAHHRLSAALLAHLLIFLLFLETVDAIGRTEEHKQLWLLIQLNPVILNAPEDFDLEKEPFVGLSDILAEEDGAYVRENIADTLRKIRILLGDDTHLFFTLDESQVAVKELPESFVGKKPLLPEILRIWASHLKADCSFIIAGTHIPKALFDGEVEGSDYLWYSGTSGFDNAEIQERYVSQFLPPAYAASPSGRFLISRIWRWLRGR